MNLIDRLHAHGSYKTADFRMIVREAADKLECLEADVQDYKDLYYAEQRVVSIREYERDRLTAENERLEAENDRKQGVINDLCVDGGIRTDLLRDCFPHVPGRLKDRIVDIGAVDFEDNQ